MTSLQPRLTRFLKLFCIAVVFFTPTVQAWDALGHRLTAYIAWDRFSATEKYLWIETLRAHPRFQQDFVDAMPANIAGLSDAEIQRWQFGQAAIWPDIARGFQGFDRRRFDFPDRHWINGAWVRADVPMHGNLYLDTTPWDDIPGPDDADIHQHSQADNVLTGLVYAHWVLQQSTDAEERAIALTWLLHLIGDIHQPLHTGALVSARLFPEGDRGGNQTRVNGSNLHAVWDQALRGPTLNNNLRELDALLRGFEQRPEPFAPGSWLLESREILLSSVYPANVISNIRRSENTGNSLGNVSLSESYREDMRAIALQRVADAGQRIRITLQALTDIAALQ
jgi:hypothetical protein